MSVKLYYVPNIQGLTYVSSRDVLEVENKPMDRYETVFYKGSTNTLDFSIRDNDRKPVNLIDKSLNIYITKIETGAVQLITSLEIIDTVKGYARLTLTDTDMLDWAPAFYSYSVTVTEDNGREGFAFTNQVYRATGSFELKDGAIPNPASTAIVTTFLDQSFFFENDTFVSSIVTASESTLHSFVWYLTGFTGTITIQGTVSSIAPSDDNAAWSDLDFVTYTLTAGDGLVAVNLTGSYTFFRFLYEPDTLNTGTVDKVLYR